MSWPAGIPVILASLGGISSGGQGRNGLAAASLEDMGPAPTLVFIADDRDTGHGFTGGFRQVLLVIAGCKASLIDDQRLAAAEFFPKSLEKSPISSPLALRNSM